MITITMKNVTAKIENLPNYLSNKILEMLSYMEESFGKKPKAHYLFNPMTSITYTGLIPHIIRLLDSLQIKYIINDLRVKPEASGNLKVNIIPRDYQQNIIDNISSRDIIQAATGAGKTFIMAKIIAKHNVYPTIVIVPKVSLAIQIKNEFEKFLNTDVGIYTGQDHDIKNITICTPQSVPNHLLESCKMIMWDEFHNASAYNTWYAGIKAVNAYYRYGFSATPWRDDGTDILLESITNIRKPHLSISASTLIRRGFLVPCTINFIPIKQVFEFNGNYDNLYKTAIVNNTDRNNKIINTAITMNKQNRTILILIKNIEHGIKLKEMLIKQKLRVAFISGENSDSERQDTFNKIKSKQLDILIGSTIADEGLDLPILDCLILAGGGQSSTRAFQRVGRVLRLYDNKKDAIIYDFEDYTPILHKHYLIRRSLYELEPEWIIK